MVRRTHDRVDPWLLAEQEQVLEGRIPLETLSRLAPLLVENTGEAAFVLQFGRDESGRSVIHSSVRADLKLECQRCLEAMTHAVDFQGELALVRGLLEAEQLPRELDPLMIQESGLLEVQELIEDELLLSIPVSPRHQAGTCQAHENETVPQETSPEVAGPNNPFAVLAGLKTGSTDDN